MPNRKHAAALVSAAALVVSAAACSTASNSAGSSGKTLVIDNSFVLQTADPGRMFEPTGELVDYALYDTLLTFNGSDVTKPVPDLATSYTSTNGDRTYTFTLNPKARFSDGTPVTAQDVVFSFQRLINLKGNPSFLLQGETITAPNSHTVVLTSAQPNPALPYILPNPALGVLNAKVVEAHGGTDAADASTADTAENYLNNHSAGSGPYVLSQWSLTSQVVLKENPKYWGPKPAYSTIVIRNTPASVQRLDVLRGGPQISTDLSPSQAEGITGAQVIHTSSANVFFVFTNENPKISNVTPNKDFQQAVRYGINYASLVSLAGSGARQTPGIIPSMFAGSLPTADAVHYDLAKAKAELAASGLHNPSVNLAYPSDIQVNGLSFGDLASRIQVDLAQVGIKVNLAPGAIQVALQAYRDGQEQMGLWYWGPDFPDPSDYLNFLPGALVGLRAGWVATADPALKTLGGQAADTTVQSQRVQLYHQIQQDMNQSGPFMPLIQPAAVLVASTGIKNVQPNPLWLVDIRGLG
jgi:peptide/nickel transport system substrate-binding protein